MGAGLNGQNGINPEVLEYLSRVYVRPMLLYDLKCIHLTKSDLSKLEGYQRRFLRQIQHLPERVASCAVYILTGLLQVEAEIHRNQLSLFGNIIRQTCVEHDLAMRQLAIKDSRSKSWFISLQSVLLQYGLPSAYEFISDPPMKLEWKRQVKTAINAYWRDTILKEVAQEATLKYLNSDNYRPGRFILMNKCRLECLQCTEGISACEVSYRYLYNPSKSGSF